MAPSHLFIKVWALCHALGGATPPPGSPPDLGYNHVEASKFAALAAMAYCDGDQILDWDCGPCTDSGVNLVPGQLRVLDAGVNNATRVVVGKFAHEDGCLVAFRGSISATNWRQDFRFRLVDPGVFSHCDGCRVEKGFYSVWDSVRELTLEALSEVGCEAGAANQTLRVTGHSLGGALTHLAMFDLEDAGYKIARSFSFEAPRVGNNAFSKEFSAHFAGDLFRITHFMDPVPHLPPRSLRFVHLGAEVYYDKSGNYTICPNEEDKRCADRFRDDNPLLLLHAADHCASPVVPGGYFCGSGLSCAPRRDVVLV